MYFYVFLQPEMFEEAIADGEDAVMNVASILGGFLQNCFLSVFEDDRWGQIVKEKLKDWPETMTRRRIMSLLVQLKKRNRILFNITPDYEGGKPDLDCVFDQADSIPLDLILVVESQKDRSGPDSVEVSTRRRYQLTAFEPQRLDLAVSGKTCAQGEMDETSFMDFHFAKTLRYAEVINICDRFCGKSSFTLNYRYTISRFMAWLGAVLIDPSNCKIIFHMGQPKGNSSHFILGELTSVKNGPLNGTSFEVCFYNESLPDPSLPHQRFILTNQVALDIDRGLDFLDGSTHQCRDTYINYQSPTEAQRLLNSYASGCVSKTEII